MSATPSTMLPLGTKAPDFSLPDTTGKLVTLSDFNGARALVVIFICNHCPFVKNMRPALVQVAREYQPRGAAFAAISSNDVSTHPQDGPEFMKQEAIAAGFPFPYLYDEHQWTAKAYHAACTPDLFLFDGNHRLVYRGQFDASRPNNKITPTGQDLRAALDAVLLGKPVPEPQIPSIGCNIKWKPGNEPDYFRRR